jgi:aminopeptidase N
LIGTARSPENLTLVRGLLDGTTRFEGLKVDTDLRWMIVNALSGRGAAGDDLIAAELERDPTDEGQRHAASARAGRPNPDAKQQAWTSITEDAQLSLATMRSIMRGFHRFDQRRLLEPYVSKYFAALDPIWKSREIEVAIAFARSMYPTVIISDDVVRMTGERLDGQTPGPIHRILLESRDNMQRAIRGRALDASASEKVTAPR